MTEEAPGSLTPNRFGALADAYGAEVARWPVPVRARALAMATEPWAAAVLAKAESLDSELDRWLVTVPETALSERILCDAPTGGTFADAFRHLRWWWSAMALGVAAAGAATGSIAAAAISPTAVPAAETSTAFGDVDLAGDGGGAA